VTAGYLRRYVIPAAYELLPPAMASAEATAMLIAIAWQESRINARRQKGGPAAGIYQFELSGGIHGVLGHAQTRELVVRAMRELIYPAPLTPFGCGVAVEHNDVAATVFARLLLWTLPDPLPRRDQPDVAWAQYRRAWRPGKPHPETWAEAWAQGWAS
jgi:hypothetical protein